MGDYSVPEEIRKLKPKGTIVKRISGGYYVYEHTNIRGADGKRHSKTGKLIGSIKPNIGFVSNSSFNRGEDITTLEFGEYAIVYANSKNVLDLLTECFNPLDAVRIYILSVIHFVNGFVYLKDISNYYEMSCLSYWYSSLKMGYDAISSLIDSLGRRQNNVLKFEEKLVGSSSGPLAIDGHVIGSCSDENDLAEKGYKFQKLGEPQLNLLMTYDVETGKPVISRIYSGSTSDKVSVRDLFEQIKLTNKLFVIDRGFYSEENLLLFTANGNSYIVPLAKNLNACKESVKDMTLSERFTYQKGRKSVLIEYKEVRYQGRRVLVCRDTQESILEQENYVRHMELGEKNYTEENFMALKDYMGVTVLQTSLEDRSAKEVFELYKKRWQIETYYNYFKNKAGYESLYIQDYYKMQGLSFIMLVAGLIHREMENAVKTIKGKTVSDCLLEARMVKINKRYDKWVVCNCKKNRQQLFKKLNPPMSAEFPSSTEKVKEGVST